MKPEIVNQNAPLKESLSKTTCNSDLTQLFDLRRGQYVNELSLFVVYFNAIPNLISENEMDCKRANRWFEKKYKDEIRDKHFFKRYFENSKSAEFDDVFYILFDDLIVYFDTNNSLIRLLYKKTDFSKVESAIKELKRFKKRKGNNGIIYLLVGGFRGYDTIEQKTTKPKMRIADNYNDDFMEIHESILKRLLKPNDKGLVLLHGKPGTGKTSYIRYLAWVVKKKIIFLQPSMASAITDPSLITVLTNNPNSIFVIEDAENIIIDREKEENSPVSALLNISDGLLSDCLNIQIICSFNTDLSKVDNALMRKGRLIAKYEFRELEVEKAQKISKKLGFNSLIQEPMTLTEIYNQEEREFMQSSNRKIGFQVMSEN